MTINFLMTSLGLGIINGLFNIPNPKKIKWIVYGSQLAFHYIYISVIVFIWFNFQICDVIHHKFTNLEEEEKELFSHEHFHSIYQFEGFFQDCLNWFLKFRRHPFIEISLIVFTLIFLRYLMENFIFNNILNKIINIQTLNPKDERFEQRNTELLSKDKIALNYFTSTFVSSQVFILLGFILIYFIFGIPIAIFVLLYFIYLLVLKQFYFSSKTISGFSNFIISFFKLLGKKNFVLNHLLIHDDKSSNFNLLSLLFVPFVYTVITNRVNDQEYEQVLSPTLTSIEQYMPGSFAFYYIFIGVLFIEIFKTIFLLLSANLVQDPFDSSESDDLDQTLNLINDSHPFYFFKNSSEPANKIYCGIIYIVILFIFYLLNRDFPERIFWFILGISLNLFREIVMTNLSVNSVRRYKFVYKSSQLQSII